MSSSESDGEFYGFDVSEVEAAEFRHRQADFQSEFIENSDESDIENDDDGSGMDSTEELDEVFDIEKTVTLENLKWSETTEDVTIHQFTAKYGPTHFPELHGDSQESPPPSNYFDRQIPSEFWDILKNETNRYASQNGSSSQVNIFDLKTFIGITILMGIVVLPSLRLYWSSDNCVSNEFIRKSMSRDRYFEILRFIHLNNSENQPAKGEPGFDRLYKVRPMIDICEKSFREEFDPPKDISVDEGMVKFKGRLGFIQYMPMKPTKRGVKVWMAASSENGYIHAFQIYTGKNLDGNQEKNLGQKVVLDLTQSLWGEYRHIFYDNFFSGVDLALKLLNEKTYCCGTIRSNRKNYPLSKIETKLSKGETKVKQSGNLVATAWQDKKTVHILSTNSNPGTTEVTRKTKAGAEETVSKPNSVISYNKAMGGVDLGDQLRKYYTFGRTGTKWWRYIFFFLLNVACVNSYIIYRLHMKSLNRKEMTQLQYRILLAKNLIGGAVSPGYRRVPKRKIEKLFDQNLSGHVLVHFSGRKRVCVLCSASGRKAPSGRGIQSSFGCNICGVNLCKTCFPLYHAATV